MTKIQFIQYSEIEIDLSKELKNEISEISKLKNIPNDRYNKCLFEILVSIEYKFNTAKNLIIFCPNNLIFFAQKNLNLFNDSKK